MRVPCERARARVIGEEGEEKKRERERGRVSWREGAEGGGMRETFSSVPTARATPLSLPLALPLRVLFLLPTHSCVRECTHMHARVAICV